MSDGGPYERWRSAGRFPGFLRREARHEAAHAIVSELVGLGVVFVTLNAYGRLERGGDHLTLDPFTRHYAPRRTDPRGRERVAIVALAGHAADGRDWRRCRGAEGMADGEIVREYVPDPARQADLWHLARWLTSRYGGRIDTLAAELLATETVTGERVREIIGHAV